MRRIQNHLVIFGLEFFAYNFASDFFNLLLVRFHQASYLRMQQ